MPEMAADCRFNATPRQIKPVPGVPLAKHILEAMTRLSRAKRQDERGVFERLCEKRRSIGSCQEPWRRGAIYASTRGGVNAESTRTFDAETLKRHFPALADPRLLDLDNAATEQSRRSWTPYVASSEARANAHERNAQRPQEIARAPANFFPHARHGTAAKLLQE